MSQIFHRSANTIARVSIFGAVFFIAGPARPLRRNQPLAVGHAGARRARAADPVQPRAPRRRQRHRLPLLPHVGRGLVVRRHPADQDLHELPLADLLRQPVPRAGARQLPHRQARFSGRASTICRTSSTSITASTCTRASAARRATARSTDAADVAGTVAADGVVPRLPSPARSATSGRAKRSSAWTTSPPAEPARARQAAGRRVSDSEADELFDVPPMNAPTGEAVGPRGSGGRSRSWPTIRRFGSSCTRVPVADRSDRRSGRAPRRF